MIYCQKVLYKISDVDANQKNRGKQKIYRFFNIKREKLWKIKLWQISVFS